VRALNVKNMGCSGVYLAHGLWYCEAAAAAAAAAVAAAAALVHPHPAEYRITVVNQQPISTIINLAKVFELLCTKQDFRAV
jgi:hypothetical protein